MNIYDSELDGTDDIFNAVKEMIDKGSLGNKIEIVRMFSAAKREYKLSQLKDKFEEKSIVASQRDNNPEHGFWYQPIVLSNYSNVLYETMDQALIGIVCLKTDNLNASTWINKMLGIDTEN